MRSFISPYEIPPTAVKFRVPAEGISRTLQTIVSTATTRAVPVVELVVVEVLAAIYPNEIWVLSATALTIKVPEIAVVETFIV
jgi:hypothetical protein